MGGIFESKLFAVSITTYHRAGQNMAGHDRKIHIEHDRKYMTGHDRKIYT